MISRERFTTVTAYRGFVTKPVIRDKGSDEGLTLETPAFESLYGGQFTLSTQLIKPNYLEKLAPQFLQKRSPFIQLLEKLFTLN